jgi:hypothetical protein
MCIDYFLGQMVSASVLQFVMVVDLLPSTGIDFCYPLLYVLHSKDSSGASLKISSLGFATCTI